MSLKSKLDSGMTVFCLVLARGLEGVPLMMSSFFWKPRLCLSYLLALSLTNAPWADSSEFGEEMSRVRFKIKASKTWFLSLY